MRNTKRIYILYYILYCFLSICLSTFQCVIIKLILSLKLFQILLKHQQFIENVKAFADVDILVDELVGIADFSDVLIL